MQATADKAPSCLNVIIESSIRNGGTPIIILYDDGGTNTWQEYRGLLAVVTSILFGWEGLLRNCMVSMPRP